MGSCMWSRVIRMVLKDGIVTRLVTSKMDEYNNLNIFILLTRYKRILYNMINQHHVIYVVVAVMAFVVHKQGSDFYKNRSNDKKTTPKVYDIFHKYLPNMSSNNVLSFVANMVLLLPFVFGSSVAKEHMSYFALILLARSLFNISTILPKNKLCSDDSYTFYNVVFGHCYDKIFSGHFASGVLLSLILFRNGILTNAPFLLVGLNVINALCILLLRWHYTVDILVALFVTIVFYQNNIRLK